MISDFIASYGYYAVFVGTLFEGETLLLAAGFSAHLGLLDWRIVMTVAFVGATLGDQMAFQLGRWKGAAIIVGFPSLTQHAPKAHALLERHHVTFILINRFLYGLRIAGPIFVGSSGVPFWRFTMLNMLGAAIWTVAVTGAGYSFGEAVETIFAGIKHVEEIALFGILAAGFALWLWRRSRAEHPRDPE